MTAPLVTFADPIAAVIDVLTAALADRDESYAAGVTLSNHRPDEHVAPHVQVGLDGDSPRFWPVASRPLIRVTVWHTSAGRAYDLAQLCQGLLLAHIGTTLVRCDPAAGPVPGTDHDSSDHFATLSVHAVVRSTAL
jgi:hypothetical protein